MALPPGACLEDYEILTLIGAGGTCEVYRGPQFGSWVVTSRSRSCPSCLRPIPKRDDSFALDRPSPRSRGIPTTRDSDRDVRDRLQATDLTPAAAEGVAFSYLTATHDRRRPR